MGKALGSGVHFTWREIEIRGRPKPGVELTGRTAAWAERVGAGRVELSMTHSRGDGGGRRLALPRVMLRAALHSRRDAAAEAGHDVEEMMRRAGEAVARLVLERFPRRVDVVLRRRARTAATAASRARSCARGAWRGSTGPASSARRTSWSTRCSAPASGARRVPTRRGDRRINAPAAPVRGRRHPVWRRRVDRRGPGRRRAGRPDGDDARLEARSRGRARAVPRGGGHVAEIGFGSGRRRRASSRARSCNSCRRSAEDNKYSAGSVLVVGGSPGMTGAAALAARAAFRADAGYVAIAAPPESLPVLEALSSRR